MELAIQAAHIASLPRRVPYVTQVAHIGHIPEKTNWIDREFEVMAFSLILSCRGHLYVAGREIEIKAPCVIVEYPPLHFRYGPTPTWQELYISYPGSSLAAFTQMGLVRPDRFTWPIRSVSKCKRFLDELAELMRHLDVLGNADRIDRLAERIISETLLDAEEVVVDAAHRSLLELKGYVEEHYLEELDFDGVARKFGFSPSTFRRVWLKHMPESPVRFVNNLRMKQACRLLCETDLPIMEIAESLGYGDPLYFSKKFHKHTGETARDYRRRYLSLTAAR